MTPESKMEQIVFSELKSLGWNIDSQPRFHITISERELYIPDFALYDEEGNLFGIVDVISRESILRPKTIEILHKVSSSNFTSVMIVTNGYSYDIYVYGKFATQTNICPSIEVCRYLIRHSAEQEG